MRYALARALHSLKRQWVSSLVVMAQFTLGFFLLYLCANILLSAGEAMPQTAAGTNGAMQLTWRAGRLEDSGECFTQADERALLSMLGETTDFLTLYQTVAPLVNSANGDLGFGCFLLADGAYAERLGTPYPLTQAETDGLLRIPNFGGLLPEIIATAIQRGMDTAQVWRVEPSLLCRAALSARFSLGSPQDQMPLFLVATDMRRLINGLPAEESVQRFLLPKTADGLPVRTILETLYARHPMGAEYFLQDALPFRAFDIEQAQMTSQSLLLVAAVTMLAVSIGFVGSLLAAMEKRKGALSLLHCLGVSKRRLGLELFFETALLILVSAAVGVCVGALFGASIAFNTLSVRAHLSAALAPLFVSLLLCAAFSFLQFRILRQMPVAQALQEDL